MKTRQEIAAIFGCTPEQAGKQFAKNHAQLMAMYLRACETGKRVNGYTSEQLRQLVNSIPMSE